MFSWLYRCSTVTLNLSDGLVFIIFPPRLFCVPAETHGAAEVSRSSVFNETWGVGSVDQSRGGTGMFPF